MKAWGRFGDGAPPKRDPGARHEPRTGVRRPAHVGATPFWDRPISEPYVQTIRFEPPPGDNDKQQH